MHPLLYAAMDKGERVANLTTMVTPIDGEHEGVLSWWSRPQNLDVDRLFDSQLPVPGCLLPVPCSLFSSPRKHPGHLRIGLHRPHVQQLLGHRHRLDTLPRSAYDQPSAAGRHLPGILEASLGGIPVLQQGELAFEMLQVLHEWVLDTSRSVMVLGDSEYSCKTLVKRLPPGFEFTGPVVTDAALFDFPEPKEAGGARSASCPCRHQVTHVK